VITHGDLVFRAQKLVLEYDGGVHRQPRQHFLDIYRLDDIMEEGWRVIRVDKYMLASPLTLLAKLRRALATR
jgi:very-short-patch-repair endonuclease